VAVWDKIFDSPQSRQHVTGETHPPSGNSLEDFLASPDLLAHILYSLALQHSFVILKAIETDPTEGKLAELMRELLPAYYSVSLLVIGGRFPEMHSLLGRSGNDYPSILRQNCAHVLNAHHFPAESKPRMADGSSVFFHESYEFYYQDKIPNEDGETLDWMARELAADKGASETRQNNPARYFALKLHCRTTKILSMERHDARYIPLWVAETAYFNSAVTVIATIRPTL
jgi:hypothetical protein